MTDIFVSVGPKRAAELSGIGSVAMLDYLQRTGVFFPRGKRGARGRGKSRRYEFRDILTLKAIRRLLDAGVSVLAIRKALEAFQKHTWSADPATLEDGNGAVRYMVASATSIYLAKDANFLIDLLAKGQLAFSFILDLDRLHAELCRSLGMRQSQSELPL
jgi:DNA-binding transcriptional MerR regulator